jgi:polysaccharide export outer membrane protein
VRIAFISLLALTAGAACALGADQSGGFADHDPRYRIQPSDVVEIHYRYTPEYDQTVTVQPDGFVALEITGDIKLQDLTLTQAKAAILQKAGERLKDPEITLILKDFQKPYFVVAGEVGAPGRFEMRGTVTAVQAVAMAGGFKNSAKHSQVLLFRKVDNEMAATRILDLKAAMTGSLTESNIDLRPGDMLVVPQNRISKIERLVKIANIGAYIPF